MHSLIGGDIVFGRKGAVDRHLFVGEGQRGWLQGSDCIRLRLLTEETNAKFFSYAFLLPSHKEWMLQQSSSKATMASLNQDVIRRIEIPLPTVRQQGEVASILSSYDDLIDINRRRIGLLEKAARMLYREWFIYLRYPGHEHVKIVDGVPEGWRRRTLKQIVEVIKENTLPSAFNENDVHIGLEHMPRRSFTLASWEPIANLASSKTRFHEGDFLFCKIRPYFHKVGFALRFGLASSDALIWRVLDPADWPITLCTISSDHFVSVASKTVKEGSKMPRADWNVLKQYPVPAPPPGLLAVFNETVNAITKQCKSLALQNRSLVDARDLLLPRLLSGEVAV